MTTGDEEAPPRELVVDAQPAPGDASDGSGSGMAPIVLTVLVAGGLAKLVSLTAAAVSLGVAVAFFILKRKPRQGRFVLRMHDDVLEVTREEKGAPTVRITLVDLIDVTLDREARPASGRGGSASERVRLAFERRAPNDPIFVPEERVTPIEAQEWYSKVRVFLRKNGWVPHGEPGRAEEGLRPAQRT